jgi:DNA-binding transcriptional LysR family regulator
MDLLTAFHAFSRVAESGSFSAVAREMGTTQPAISRQIAALEQHLGVRLLHRSTRALALTEDGRDLLVHAARVLEAVEEAEGAIGRRRASPAGLVRLGCSVAFGRLFIAPRMRALLDRHPELSIDLALSDGMQDLVSEGLDLAVRIGEVDDTALVARRIGTTDRLVLASAEYLERCGEPKHPTDLASHTCVIFNRVASPLDWQFTGPGGPVTVHVGGRFQSNSGEAMREAVLAGLGIGFLPAWVFRAELVSGAVRPLLSEWQSPRTPIHAVYPSRRHLAPRTRAVIDFLVDEFRLDPVVSTYGEA